MRPTRDLTSCSHTMRKTGSNHYNVTQPRCTESGVLVFLVLFTDLGSNFRQRVLRQVRHQAVDTVDIDNHLPDAAADNTMIENVWSIGS